MAVIFRKSNAPHWRVPADLAIDLSASALADRVAGVILQMHKDAIIAGVRAGDGVPQPPLDPKGGEGKDAAKGKRSQHRGNRTGNGGFADTLRRAKTKKSAGDTNTEVRIIAPRGAPGWLREEFEKRGVQYFFTDGLVAAAIERVTMEWLDEITRPGPKRRGRK